MRKIDRRSFIKGAAALGAATLGLGAVNAKFVIIPTEDGMIYDEVPYPRIEQNVHSPTPHASWAMVIDLRRCIGCSSCATACRNEHDTPAGGWRSWVKKIEVHGEESYLPRLCNHCQDAPCVKVCPTKASYKREDGAIEIDYDKCIACKYCIMACPYDARFINTIRKTADKCSFCVHRVDKGRDPACVEACPTLARTFGDLNDEESKISQILAVTPAKVLKDEQGTNPHVYYINHDARIEGIIKFEEDPIELVEGYKHTYPQEAVDAMNKREFYSETGKEERILKERLSEYFEEH